MFDGVETRRLPLLPRTIAADTIRQLATSGHVVRIATAPYSYPEGAAERDNASRPLNEGKNPAVQRLDFRFDDPDQMPAAMSAVAANFSVRPLGGSPFRSSVRAARLRNVGLFLISMTDSEVVSEDRLGFFSINVAPGGPFEARVEGATEKFDIGDAYVALPEDAFHLRVADQTPMLVMNVFRRRLDDYAHTRSGGQDETQTTLPNRLRLSQPAGQTFRRFLSFLWHEAQSGSPLLRSERSTTELEDALLDSLLLTASVGHCGTPARLPEASVRRGTDYIMGNLDRALSVGRIAMAAGVHGRTLQRAFRARFGVGVMEYVRDCRLDRARETLLVSDPAATTVTDVAVASGFSHLGRFAAAYARRFGELPSETLAKRGA